VKKGPAHNALKLTAKRRRGKMALEEEKVVKANEEGFKRTCLEVNQRLRESHINIRAVPAIVREHEQMLGLLKARGIIDHAARNNLN
jgi:hypothetical protein